MGMGVECLQLPFAAGPLVSFLRRCGAGRVPPGGRGPQGRGVSGRVKGFTLTLAPGVDYNRGCIATGSLGVGCSPRRHGR